MKVSIKPCLQTKDRRKDGSYAIHIRIIFKGGVRRLPTTLECYKTDLTKSGKLRNPDLIFKGEELAGRMREAISGLTPFDLERMNVDDIVALIRSRMAGDTFHLDFFEWGDKVVAGKKGTTMGAYSAALNALERFLGRRQLDINEISKSMLLDFAAYIDDEPRIAYVRSADKFVRTRKRRQEGGAATRHLAKLAHIFNAAKERYNDEDTGVVRIPRSPFSTIHRTMPAPNGQKNLGGELMQTVIDAETDDANIRTALDVFILSFLFMGANLADLWETRAGVGKVWRYNRRKTRTRRADKAEMRVEVPAEAAPYLERLKGQGGYWLNVLHDYAVNKDRCTSRVNRELKRWAEAQGLEPFTFYAARKTWASLARRAGVEKATIDECLCHVGDLRMADIYIEKDWDLLAAANRKVIDSLRWK